MVSQDTNVDSHGSPIDVQGFVDRYGAYDSHNANVVMDDEDDMDLISPHSFHPSSSQESVHKGQQILNATSDLNDSQPSMAGHRWFTLENEALCKFLVEKGLNPAECISFLEAQGQMQNNLVHNQPNNGDGDAAQNLNPAMVQMFSQVRSSQLHPITHWVQEESKERNISHSGKKPKVSFPTHDVPIANSGNAQSAQPTALKTDSPWKLALTNGSSSKSSLQFLPPPSSLPNSVPTIRPPPEFLKTSQSPWQACILGYFPKSGLPFKLVEKAANNLWLHLGFQKLLMVKKGLFVFKFNSIQERDFILSKPWNFFRKSIILQPWHEGKPLEATGFSKLPVWVKFHEIPCSYWSMDGLSYIASAVGKPLQLDALTSKLEPMAFAKILVEIEASSPCPPKILVPVLNADQQTESLIPIIVEYLNLPHLCSSCKLFGHILSTCPHQQPSPTPLISKPLQGHKQQQPPPSPPLPHPLPSPEISSTSKPLPSPTQTINNKDVGLPEAPQSTPPLHLSSIQSSAHSDSPTPPPNHAFLSKLRNVDEIDGKKHNLRKAGAHVQLVDAEGFQAVYRKRNRRGSISSSPPA